MRQPWKTSYPKKMYYPRIEKAGIFPHSLSIKRKEKKLMPQKRQIHDGIAGGLITAGVALGYYVDPLWLLLPGILGVTLLQSRFTGFCPVYYILDRTCPNE